MNKNIEHMINKLVGMEMILPEDIPDIGLYMDQVTTFMETRLGHRKRYAEDKVMTKTMINNYTKNRLLPPSDKKKYSREHLLMIIMIYYFKNVLSINDIQTILKPLADRYFAMEDNEGDGPDLSGIYEKIVSSYDRNKETTKADLMKLVDQSKEEFADNGLSDSDQRFLDDFTLICYLSYDIYIRKQIMEGLIDDYRRDYPDTDKGKNRQKKKS